MNILEWLNKEIALASDFDTCGKEFSAGRCQGLEEARVEAKSLLDEAPAQQSTADLIAELEKRRPVSCQPCINKSKSWYCAGCFWGLPGRVKGMNDKDNFREA